jgi:hypothetical protein
VASGFTLAGFHLAAFIQLKMALNNCCSPDLLNVRRQPSFGWRPTSGSFYSRAPQQAALPSRFARAIQRSPSLTLIRSLQNSLRSGGADRDRTGDLLLAKQALSQLSYSPLKPVISI